MIFEAVSTTKDTNGCDIGAIVHYIEVRWRSLLIFNPCMSWKIFVLKEAPLGCRLSLLWLKKPSLHTIRMREETKFYQTLKLC